VQPECQHGEEECSQARSVEKAGEQADDEEAKGGCEDRSGEGTTNPGSPAQMDQYCNQQRIERD
jgi:hypothetical protein